VNREEFTRRLTECGRDVGDFLHLPGPDSSVNPEGRVIIEHSADAWTVRVEDRGPQHVRTFADEYAAYDFAFRRWVLWEDV
jgi:hypothetical protein